MERVDEEIGQCASRQYSEDETKKDTQVGECVTKLGNYLCPSEYCGAEARKALIDIGKFYAYLHMYCPGMEKSCRKTLTDLACMKEENPDVCKWYLNDADQAGRRAIFE